MFRCGPDQESFEAGGSGIGGGTGPVPSALKTDPAEIGEKCEPTRGTTPNRIASNSNEPKVRIFMVVPFFD